jgi:hypothetical protein
VNSEPTSVVSIAEEPAVSERSETERLMELITTLNGEMSKLRLILAEKDERIAQLVLERAALKLHAEDSEHRQLEMEKEVALERFRMNRNFISR